MSTIEKRREVSLPMSAVNDSDFLALHQVLADRAQRFGDRRAYTFIGKDGETHLTFAELDRKARAIGATLQNSVEPGDRVLLLFHAGLDFISSFFGCLYAGALAVPATYPKPRRPMPRLSAITRNCKAVAALTESGTLETIDQTTDELKELRWVTVDDIDPSAADALKMQESSRDQLAFLQYTSGSTSDPKGVMVSHGNLLHNLEMIRQGFGLRSVAEGGEVQTGVFWLPAYHDMGLIGGILESLYVGGHSVLMSPASFLQRPIGWLEAMSKHSAAISGAPNFAYELVVSRSTEEQRKDLDLSNWRLAFCGAEPVRPATLQQFSEAFAVSGFRHDSFYPCYGLAESTLLAAGNIGPSELTLRRVDRLALGENRVEVSTNDDNSSQVLVGCGAAIHGQQIAIVNPATRERCEENVIGEVWVQGESIAQGYWGLEDESEATFRATIAGATDGGKYLRTGDLGFVLDNHLFVTGRVKDVIIIRGRNHYPQDIERTAADSHEALRLDSGAVFTIDSESGQEQLVVVQEVDRQYRNADFEEVIRQVRRSVSESHELEVFRVVLIRHANLPRTTSGKVQRNLCRQQLVASELKVLADWQRQTDQGDSTTATSKSERFKLDDRPMTPDEIDRLGERVESWLLNWLVQRAAIPKTEVHRDKPFAEYGLDSLTAVELSQELEDWLGVEVVPTVAWNYPTPATLSVYLAREASGANAAEAEAAAAEVNVDVEDEFAQLLAEIEGLSDDEAKSMLENE